MLTYKTEIEKTDTQEIVNSKYINWEFYRNSTIMITGATGLIGVQLVKAILCANDNLNLKIKVLALVRNKEKASRLLGDETEYLRFLIQDIIDPIKTDEEVNYIIHTANGTSSKSFVESPVETIDSIITGTKNVLDFARKTTIKSLIYLSSMEVYGRTDFEKKEPLKENDYGYIDISEVRSSYPEGKRLAENMCVAYSAQYNLPIKIARLVQTIGAGVSYDDNRVFAQFARNIVERQDIILHTKGESVRNYCYITDSIIGMLVILERGINGECYNISNIETACSIKEMAEKLCAKYKSSRLKFELNNDCNRYYLPKLKTILSSEKLESLNWEAKVDLEEMYERLINNFKIERGV